MFYMLKSAWYKGIRGKDLRSSEDQGGKYERLLTVSQFDH